MEQWKEEAEYKEKKGRGGREDMHAAEGSDGEAKERQGVPSLSSQTQASVVLKAWCVAMGTMPSYRERTWGYLFFESSV